MDKLFVRILGSLIYSGGGFTAGSRLFGEYGGIAGGVVGFLVSLYLWKD